MADRRVRLVLEAQVDQFNRRMQEASRQSEGLGSSLREAVNRPEVQRMGRQLAAFGTATVGALGMATKSAIDWETAWTDVMRRTDGTPQQLEALEAGLRGIATELPTTHQEVAEVAASAAQLGVAVDDVEGFTRVMIDMGNTTNMTADQAATAMARFANIMGTPTDEMSNLGSAIVDLGNNSATTESEIMDMATRLAGAGDQAGLSEGEILGLAASMSSLGIRSQAGGTALTRTMNTIGLEVDTGGEKLETFAETAGMTSEEFATAWEEDAASALLAFVEGLGNAEERGLSMNEVLQDLGITSEREADVLRRLASDVDLTADAIERGTSAYEENTAMAEEAGYVYDTVAAQLLAFKSNINDAAIEIGQSLLPALEAGVDWLNDLVTKFADLPGPAKDAAAALGGFLGAGALATGGFLLLAPGIFSTVDALKGVVNLGARPRRIIGNLGRAAGMAGAAVGILALVDSLARFYDTEHDVQRTSERIISDMLAVADAGNEAAEGVFNSFDMSIGSGIIDEENDRIIRTVETIGDASIAVEALQDRWNSGLSEFGGLNTNAADLNALEAQLEATDSAASSMVTSGNLDVLAQQLRGYADDMREAGLSSEDLGNVLPGTTTALLELKNQGDLTGQDLDLLNEMLYLVGESSGRASFAIDPLTGEIKETGDAAEDAGDGAGFLDEALGDMGASAEEAALSLSELVTQLVESGMINRDARAAARDYEQALDTLTDSIEENGTTLDTTTDAGRQNEAALDAIADAGIRSAQAMADNGASQEELQESLTGTYGDLVSAAEQFGLTGQDAHEMAAEILGVPDSVEVTSDMDETAQNIAEWLNEELDEVERPRLATILAESNTGLAESDLTEAARDRIADIIAEPDSVTAEGELTDTARQRIADILADSETWDAEADFNETARGRIADIFADPDSYTAEGDLNDTARERIADITADPSSYRADVDLNETARDRQANITASASTWSAESDLNSAARTRYASIIASVTSSGPTVRQTMDSTGLLTGPNLATGGAVRGPGTGTSDDIPAMLSNGEHVFTAREVQMMGGQAGVYNFRSNLQRGATQRPSGRDMVPGYAAGGAVQARQLAAAMAGAGAGGSGGVSIGEITAVGGDTQQVVNRVGDEIFRRLRQEGVQVGSF